MSGPLDGVRVLDVTTVVMGPYATQILADFGADVIKLEPPGGDVMRHNAPTRSRGMGHIFMNANRNKRSIVLDLKQDAVCAALYRREKSGTGQRVDVPMFESMVQTVLGEHMGGYTYEPQAGEMRGELGYARMLAKERRPYETSDGYVCVLIYNDKQWRAFFELIGRADLLSDPRFATQEARSRDFEGAYALVAAEMAKRSTAEWLAALEQADIPVQRMNSLADIVEDPHLAAIGYFRSIDHPSEGRIRTMAVPSEWSESAPEYRRHAPRLGEHTREVLREAGLRDGDIDRLIAGGAALAC